MLTDALVGQLLDFVRMILVAILPVGGPLGIAIPSGWFAGYSWIDGMVNIHVALQVALVLVGLAGSLAMVSAGLKIFHAIRG